MRRHLKIGSKRISLPVLSLLLIGAPAFAAPGDGDSDEERFVWHNAIRLEDCPEVKVLGAGGARVISLSPRTFLGVETSNLTPELREHFGVSSDAGVMLSKIVEDSAAEAAGLAVGDIITRVEGDEITSAGRLGRAIRGRQGGDAVEIEYWRDGEMHYTTATLQERERCTFDIGDSLRAIEIEDLPDLSELGELGVEIGGEALESALEALRDQDWEMHFEGLKEIDMERIEERMEEVQERLERLEERLERKYGREIERAERDMERAVRERERAVRRELGHIEHEEERAVRELERAERERARAERDRERAERDREDGEGNVY